MAMPWRGSHGRAPKGSQIQSKNILLKHKMINTDLQQPHKACKWKCYLQFLHFHANLRLRFVSPSTLLIPVCSKASLPLPQKLQFWLNFEKCIIMGPTSNQVKAQWSYLIKKHHRTTATKMPFVFQQRMLLPHSVLLCKTYIYSFDKVFRFNVN